MVVMRGGGRQAQARQLRINAQAAGLSRDGDGAYMVGRGSAGGVAGAVPQVPLPADHTRREPDDPKPEGSP